MVLRGIIPCPLPGQGPDNQWLQSLPGNKFAGLIRHQRFHHLAGIRVRFESKVPFYHQQYGRVSVPRAAA
ncbi:Uncharacterised protein [Klebsiella pneumoniae]|uniref:Uncharacterized protein n=1 Tax=Klebsiella pneumoniae TaxID=573 RepID=A0A378BFL1_KLEPN|nr:Uncharacterised protein [Klebsiella pneumoniae]